MKRSSSAYKTAPFPKVRLTGISWMQTIKKKNIVQALIEMDVTKARQILHEYRATTGKDLSFTAFVIYCLAQAIDENKAMHAYRKGKRQLIMFEEVDVAIAIERKVDGQSIPMPYIIRAANKKSLQEIHQEIRAAQTEKVEQAKGILRMQRFGLLPDFIGKALFSLGWWLIRKYPELMKRIAGTVMISSLSMFGSGVGWGIAITGHSLTVVLGGIAKKPGAVEGRIEIREYLCMTVSVDHDVIDGAPLARFLTRLKQLVENGYGLTGESSLHLEDSSLHSPLSVN